jgi:hypothetical protein
VTTYRPPTKQPCSDCPFRRAAMPGWLGAGSPESFIDCMNRDEPLPCHQTIDYDDPDWLEKWSAQESGSMCAGALIFMANKMQRPRTRGFPTLPPDKVAVFSNTVEFVRYHREAGTHSWDDDAQNEGAKLQRELVRRGAEAAGQPIVDHKNKTRRADNSDLNALLAQAAAGPMRAPLPAAKTRKRKKKSKGPYRRRGIRRRSVDNVNAKG